MFKRFMDAGKSGYRTKASAGREGGHSGHQDSADDGFTGSEEDGEEGENCEGETKGGVTTGVNNGGRCDAVVETGLLSSTPLSLSSSLSSSSSSTSSSSADLGGPCGLTSKARRNESKKYYEFSQCRLLKTISLCSCFAGIGFSNALLGTTVVHMEHLLATNTQTMAFTFTCQAIGYTVGGLVCAMIFSRINPEIGFTVSIIIQAAATIATGYAGHISTFMVWIGVVGIASGYVETAGQSYGVSLWTRHRFKEPFLQGVHTIWSLAAMIEPLIIHPFLGEFYTNSTVASLNGNLTMENQTEEVIRCANASNCTENFTSMEDMKNWTDTGVVDWQEAIIQQARYAYLTVGFLIFPSSVLFTAVYLYSCSPLLLPRKSESVSTDETSDDCKTTSSISEVDQRRMLRFVFLFLLFIVCLLNACCENIPEAYMTMFVIKYLGWPVQRGTLIMSVFYGTQSAGCLVGVGLSTVVRPRTMIVFNLCISIIAYLLLLCAPMQDAVVLVSVALAGYGTSSTFAAIVLWVSESVQVSGGVSATLMIGGALGDMTGPLIIGQLFESYSPLWLIYSQIMITLAMLLLFVLLLLFIHRNKKFINLDTPLAPTNLDTPLAPRTKN